MLHATQFDADHNPRTLRSLPLSYHFRTPERRSRRLPYTLVVLALALLSIASVAFHLAG